MTLQEDNAFSSTAANLSYSNNSNDDVAQLSQGQGGDFTTEDQYNAVVRSTLALRLLICIGGMLGNAINIRAFRRMGLEDSVTVVFFNLAISDFIILCIALVTTATTICSILERNIEVYFHFNPFYVTILSAGFNRLFAYVTIVLTTFLALQRCLCVIIPLHFKGVFTRFRTYVITAAIWIFFLLCALTYMSMFDIRQVSLPQINSSITFILMMRPQRRYVMTGLNVMGIVVHFSCEVIVLLCVLILAHALRKSVRFRQTNSAVSVAGTATKAASDIADNQKDIDITSKDKIASKETQIIIQVSIVCILFLVTSVPQLVIIIAQSIVPELGIYKKYHYTYSSFYDIKLTVELVNSAANFFVYYKFNTKFRQLCFNRL